MFIAVRTTALIHAFIPGASPPDVKIAIFFICLKILNKLIKCIFNKIKIEKLKKILLISYYWKNDNSVGKLRWYNLVKELKKLNYNIYNEGQEYSWHIDAVPGDPVRDIKLTALLNLSEESYEGGELSLFRANEIECSEFNTPGSAIIFPSFINHKVNKITSGRRNTLAIWLSGPKFR